MQIPENFKNWLDTPTKKSKIVVIYGPTGSGKTALSLEIARKYQGSIISADSRQIYRELSIGTGKILPNEMGEIIHYGLDLISVTDLYSAGVFASYARTQISAITRQSSLPIICGGTGLYMDMALAEPSADRWTADGEYRLYLEELVAGDAGSIHRLLQEIDPRIAQTLHPNATRHIMGALEYHHATGKRKSDSISSSHTIDYLYDIFWITPYIDSLSNRDALYARIDQRISQMMQAGLLAEYDTVVQQYGSDVPGLCTIGYRECALYRRREIVTLSDLESIIAQKNRNYAKRQITWNKKYPNSSILG